MTSYSLTKNKSALIKFISFASGFLSGFEGDTCEVAVDHCQPMPCQNGGTCRNIPGGYKCDCIGEDVDLTEYTGDPSSVYR